MNRHIRQTLAAAAAFAFITSSLSGCSSDLGPETLPSTTESTEITETEETEPTEETEETTESAEETSHGPISTPIRFERPVDVNGQLKVDGAKILNKDGEQIQFRGVSTAGLNKCVDIFNDQVVATFGYDWGCDIIRIVVTADSEDGQDYNKDPDTYFNTVCKYTDTIIEEGLYVVIDWDIHGDPMKNKDNAVDFFSRISAIYGDKENIIYEICSEPSGKHFDDDTKDVNWSRIKKYANEVTSAIRENDPDNIIICGTPDSSSGIDQITEKPLKGDNICYAVHNYVHGAEDDLRNKCTAVMEAGLCLVASDWNTLNGEAAASEWLAFLEQNKISWIGCSVGSTSPDGTDALVYSSYEPTEGKVLIGHWPEDDMTEAGLFLRDKLVSGR